MVKMYKKRPVFVEAIQFTHTNWEEIKAFTNGLANTFILARKPDGLSTCVIPTLEGNHVAIEGDYIIKGVKGEFYPCKPDIFNMTYE